ncbi:MAG: DMT family transporter [Paracoccaceae bacterium]
MTTRSDTLPVILAFLAAALWGLWWIPMRWLQGYGLDGAQGGLLLMSGAALACIALLVFRPHLARLSPTALVGAAMTGVALTAYSAALNYTDVVRAILLFYLAPVWSKLIERFFLGMPWPWTSTVALVTAMAGAVLLLGTEAFHGGLRAGDAIAVASGMIWAAGAAFIYTSKNASSSGLTAIAVLCTCVASILFVLVDGTPMPNLGSLPVLWSGLALGVVYVIPVLFLTLWSAQRLSPATMSFLLTGELLCGVGSGAIWLDEPFGWVHAGGTVLILLGALTEVLIRPGRRVIG